MNLESMSFEEIASYVNSKNVRHFCATKNLGTYFIDAVEKNAYDEKIKIGNILLSQEEIVLTKGLVVKSYSGRDVAKLYKKLHLEISNELGY